MPNPIAACRTHALEVLGDMGDKAEAKRDLEASARVVEKIFSIVKSVDFVLSDVKPPPSIPETPSKAVTRSFKNFDLAFTLPDHGAFEHVGENLQEETKRSLLVDLLPTELPAEMLNSSDEIHAKRMASSNFELIQWCMVKCVDLESKGAVSSVEVAIRQKIALIELVFGRLLPIPDETGEIYYDEDDKDKALTACEDINNIFWHYVKACKSTESDKHLDAERLVTLTSILAMYDTLLRNSGRSEDGPAELKVFNRDGYSLDTHSFTRTALADTFSSCHFRSMWAAARVPDCLKYFDKNTAPETNKKTVLMKPKNLEASVSTWYIYGDKKSEKIQFDFATDDGDDAFLKVGALQ